MPSPTQRTLALLRAAGMVAQVVERWNAFARKRVDLFGVVDVVALDLAHGRTIGVQTTSGTNVAVRIEKIYATEAARHWLLCGNRLVVHGWAKRGARGRRKVFTCREVEIVLDGTAMVAQECENGNSGPLHEKTTS